MKTILPLICLTLASVGLMASPASGQFIGNTVPPSMQAGGQPGVTPFQAAFATNWPGRYWFGVNLADNGFGYSGSYASLGAKTRLFDDYFDGRWLVEGRGHMSLDRGDFFGNFGIERVFSVDAAGADIVFGAWYDVDGDQPGDFAHTMNQFAVNAAIKTQRYDIYGNGYIPTGTTDYSLGDPTGQTVFFRNNIVVQPGIDSALEGWDANLRLRPEAVAMVNGTAEIGVYNYQSELIDSFVGVRTRFGFQALQGMIVNLDMNYDERFDFTAGLRLGWMLGGRGPNAEYAGLGRDLEQASRPDHITRYQQDLVLAIDPDTGVPYVVFHVDNTAAAGGDGSFESRFDTIAEAQAASGLQNIIFVHDGDGTTTGLNTGIVLKDGQMLLGDGVVHYIPVQNGNLFAVYNDLDGNRPTITNVAGNAVTLADRNTVRGFVIDGAGTNMTNGIFGDGTVNPLSNGTIEDVTIQGVPLLNGISLNAASGTWQINRNDITTALIDGIFIDNVTDPNARFFFDSNTVSNNRRDGIHIEDWDGRQVRMSNNVTSNNDFDGVQIARYGGTAVNMDILNHTANNNSRNGLFIDTARGDLRVNNSSITNNASNGISINNFTNAAGGTTLLSNNTITGNGTGGGSGILLNLTGGIQSTTITGSTIDNNGIGINSISNGVGTVQNLNVTNNTSISNNLADAIRVSARGGSTTNFLLSNAAANPLTMTGNGGSGGFGIALFAEDGGANTSVLNATLRNFNMTNTGNGNAASGLFGSALGNSQLNVLVQNATFTGGVGGSSILFDLNANAGVISSIQILDTTITNSGTNGIAFQIGGSNQADITLQNIAINNGGGNGLSMAMSGNSMTQLLMDSVTISGFTFNGATFNTSNNAQFLATIQNNTITGNGPGLDPANDPYFDGINMLAANNSRMSFRMMNNNLSNNQEFGLDIQTTGNAQIDAFLSGNTVANNDTGTFSPGVNDFQVVNAAGGTVCLAMSTNFFALSNNVFNNNAPGNFTVELDGNSNGPGVPNFVGGAGNFNVVGFGTTCEPAIQAQEAVFSGAGFP